MLFKENYSQTGYLGAEIIRQTLIDGLAGKFAGQKVLVLIPDHTRSLPLPFLARSLVEVLVDCRQLDFMIALGTHPPLNEAQINKLMGITNQDQKAIFNKSRFFNHAWNNPAALTTLGYMEADEIRQIAGESWHTSLPEQVPIRINNMVLEYDHILILGPTFPHEVVGFSGGAKYLFPGISGAEMINATHWLGALAGVVRTIGIKETPVRSMIEAAAALLATPVTLVALTVDGKDLAGIFIGGLNEAWNKAADFSAQRHIQWSDKPYERVLSCAPAMYDELWTAAKAMYKLEPAVAIGGEVIIYAPHLDTVSHVHGKYIAEIGYHILPYFLENWEQFKHIPLGVLAHSTHLSGWGEMIHGKEKPNVQVTLASKISAADCAHLNLGYLDPGTIDPEDWKNREDEGVLFVPKAGEKLFRINISS
ncbi:MAG: lactate racemase domain-containing protein [Anaerolineales bacterium]|nr:lactate racemase domain-containing protein [Anaerolineales bacterium]